MISYLCLFVSFPLFSSVFCRAFCPGHLHWLYWVSRFLKRFLPTMSFYLFSFSPLPVGKARFDSSAKLAGWPRMWVPPYLGGSPLSFYLFAFKWKVGIALRPSNRLKYKKNLPDAGGTVIKEAVLSRRGPFIALGSG